MAENPSYKNTSGVQLSGENPVNDPKPHVRNRSNSFARSYPHITTGRYGDVLPFYVENGVEKDTIPLNSRHEVRTPTMLSPFIGDLEMKKAYFDVPLRAIYPLNYDLMKVPPVSGDDIPIRNTAYIPKEFFSQIDWYFRNPNDYSWNNTVTLLLVLEKFFSRASLFERLGCHLSCCFEYRGINVPWLDSGLSFDIMFEQIASYMFLGTPWPDGENRYWLRMLDSETQRYYYPVGSSVAGPTGTSSSYLSLHYMLELMRENPIRYKGFIVNGAGVAIDEQYLIDLVSGFRINVPNDINIERLFAYQLACIEYCTDDHIDAIYSTDQWRNMMMQYYRNLHENIGDVVFTYDVNGVSFGYDFSSSNVWQYSGFNDISDWIIDEDFISYLWNVLSVRKSLRFEDYFVGGRLSPLALGDVTAPVTGDSVNAYEVIRAQVYQRFLNSVNISGPEFDTYQKEVLENNAPPRQDVPKFLAMTRSGIRGYEVENTTSDNQGAIVTNVRSDDERFAFDVTLDHESILIGVLMFEARRMYSKTVDRHFYHLDRYDRFIPGLQYLGDQDISLAELRANTSLGEPFAYGVRNGEYKQRVGVVSGGVVDFLKSWAMVTDVVDSYDDNTNLDSDYIRSKNVEFDRFFAITNNSDAGWFHFIISLQNISNPIRPMDVAPNVLL